MRIKLNKNQSKSSDSKKAAKTAATNNNKVGTGKPISAKKNNPESRTIKTAPKTGSIKRSEIKKVVKIVSATHKKK